MSFYYMDVELKVQDDKDIVLTPAYFQGSIENSLTSLFGEIGGQTELQLIKFDRVHRRAILKVPEEFYTRARSAISLIGHFQDIPCHFKVHRSSKEELHL